MSGGPKYVDKFEFPSSFGFTGSSSDRLTTTVRSHDRAKPQRFAKGGKVVGGALAAGAALAALNRKKGRPLTSRERREIEAENRGRTSTVDTIRGKTRRQQMEDLGLKKGGKVGYRAGGKHRMPDGSTMKNSAMKKGMKDC
jgi:hypothetical protein